MVTRYKLFMNKFFKSISCLLTMFVVSTSGFFSGSNSFGLWLLLGTSKSKISNINELKRKYNNTGIYDYLNTYLKIIAPDIIKNNNPFSEKSDFRFDTGGTVFYQRNFNDTFFY